MKSKFDDPRLRDVVDTIVIHHAQFDAVLRDMEQWYKGANAGAEMCALVLGETGTGKTTLIETFSARHPRSRSPEGLICPVLVARLPAKPTPKSLTHYLLRNLGDPLPNQGSLNTMTDRLVENMHLALVKMLFLDDLQHFVDKRQDIALYEAAEYLKEIVLAAKVILVGLGLPDAAKVLRSNEQLRIRYGANRTLQRFDWLEHRSQDQFVAVLRAFREGLHDFDFPRLDSPEMALRMYLASGGLIRYVAKILRQAVWDALDARTFKISINDLAVARAKCVFADADTPNDNPLARTYKLTDLRNKILIAKTLCARVDRPRPVRRRGQNRRDLAAIGL